MSEFRLRSSLLYIKCSERLYSFVYVSFLKRHITSRIFCTSVLLFIINACSHLFMPQFSQLSYYSSYTVFYISIVQNACNHFIFTVLAPSKVSYWKRHLVALILFTSFLFNAYSTILPYIGVETALVCSVFPFVPHWPVL